MRLLTTVGQDPNQFGGFCCKLKGIGRPALSAFLRVGATDLMHHLQLIPSSLFLRLGIHSSTVRSVHCIFFYCWLLSGVSTWGEEDELFFFFYCSTRESHVTKLDNKDSVIAAWPRRNLLSMPESSRRSCAHPAPCCSYPSSSQFPPSLIQ